MPTGGAKTTKISIDAETGEEVREDWPFNEAMWYIKEILDARKGYGSKKGKPGAVAGGQRGQYVKVEKAEEIAGLSKEIAGMTAQLAAMPAASPARAQVERTVRRCDRPWRAPWTAASTMTSAASVARATAPCRASSTSPMLWAKRLRVPVALPILRASRGRGRRCERVRMRTRAASRQRT